MLTDSHCHLASSRYTEQEIPEVIDRARHAGVTRLITLATSLEDVDANLKLTEFPEVSACIGIHPCDVHHAPDDALTLLAGKVGHPGVCAIGETGLDYFHPAPDGWAEDDYHRRQREFLRQHFELAQKAGLNIVIHTRDQQGDASFHDALEIYRDFHSNVRAMFHCFIGPWENAEKVLQLGGILSFGGVSTFKSAHQVRETAARCPAGSFTLETDSPYLAPEPHRGKRNEPSLIPHTAERLAALRHESLDSLSAHTNATVDAFFRFNSPMS
ncbi:TatD family hydrolase [Luteolibacter pohnpeiensis]|uniref:TatD family hydrolase n=1 Tax=Luteolibacter pohnpeiensis TaxID=454153 RepID=A0A934S536_9BACT|nr:TatD family hydrolase [Luteolibacter pohnpeiensis]MBK1883270.1 TatD family hydrolase [Luteolibacter pohnpeiensis]